MRSPLQRAYLLMGQRRAWEEGSQFARKDNADLEEGDGHRHRQRGSFSEDSVAQ